MQDRVPHPGNPGILGPRRRVIVDNSETSMLSELEESPFIFQSLFVAVDLTESLLSKTALTKHSGLKQQPFTTPHNSVGQLGGCLLRELLSRSLLQLRLKELRWCISVSSMWPVSQDSLDFLTAWHYTRLGVQSWSLGSSSSHKKSSYLRPPGCEKAQSH